MKKHERTFLVHRPDFRASLQNLKKFDDWGGAELAEVILILFQVNSRRIRSAVRLSARCGTTAWHAVARWSAESSAYVAIEPVVRLSVQLHRML